MTVTITAVRPDETESLIGDTYAPQPERRPYVAVIVSGQRGRKTVHAWTKNGLKCGHAWHWAETRETAVTCRVCLAVLAAEKRP